MKTQRNKDGTMCHTTKQGRTVTVRMAAVAGDARLVHANLGEHVNHLVLRVRLLGYLAQQCREHRVDDGAVHVVREWFEQGRRHRDIHLRLARERLKEG